MKRASGHFPQQAHETKPTPSGVVDMGVERIKIRSVLHCCAKQGVLREVLWREPCKRQSGIRR